MNFCNNRAALVCFTFCLLLSGCSTLSQQAYSETQGNALEQGTWLIEGKMSVAIPNQISHTNQGQAGFQNNFSGSFVWRSNQGKFELELMNQLTNESLLLRGAYQGKRGQQGQKSEQDEGAQLTYQNQTHSFADLNTALAQVLGTDLYWQDLVWWVNHTPPQGATNLQYDDIGRVIAFSYRDLGVQYLSFHNPGGSVESGINQSNLAKPIRGQVKLMRITKGSDSQRLIIRIAVQRAQFDLPSLDSNSIL